MKAVKSLENTSEVIEAQSSRGQTLFKHTQISWIYSESFGLTIAHIRCGVCLMPLESVAVRVVGEVYLVCEEGHFVGTDTPPKEAKAEWAELAVNEKVDMAADPEIEPESSIQNHERLPRFTSRQDYNNKLESIASLFKQAYLRRITETK